MMILGAVSASWFLGLGPILVATVGGLIAAHSIRGKTAAESDAILVDAASSVVALLRADMLAVRAELATVATEMKDVKTHAAACDRRVKDLENQVTRLENQVATNDKKGT